MEVHQLLKVILYQAIKQWGTADERKSNISQTIHFPIAFSNTSYGFVLGEINIYQADTIGSRVLSKTMSNMVIFGWDYTTTSWLVLGIQQWGTSTSEKTKTFPIAFSNSCYSVLNIMNVNSNRYENPYVIDVTASSFKSGLSGVNYAMYWIAVGKQQWGEGSYSKYTFPIAFTNTSYVFVSQMNLNFEDAHYESNNYVNAKTITYITLGSVNLNRFWTAIGY